MTHSRVDLVLTSYAFTLCREAALFCFETGFYSLALPGPELSRETRLALNLWQFSCLCLQDSGTAGGLYHTGLDNAQSFVHARQAPGLLTHIPRPDNGGVFKSF